MLLLQCFAEHKHEDTAVVHKAPARSCQQLRSSKGSGWTEAERAQIMFNPQHTVIVAVEEGHVLRLQGRSIFGNHEATGNCRYEDQTFLTGALIQVEREQVLKLAHVEHSSQTGCLCVSARGYSMLGPPRHQGWVGRDCVTEGPSSQGGSLDVQQAIPPNRLVLKPLSDLMSHQVTYLLHHGVILAGQGGRAAIGALLGHGLVGTRST